MRPGGRPRRGRGAPSIVAGGSRGSHARGSPSLTRPRAAAGLGLAGPTRPARAGRGCTVMPGPRAGGGRWSPARRIVRPAGHGRPRRHKAPGARSCKLERSGGRDAGVCGLLAAAARPGWGAGLRGPSPRSDVAGSWLWPVKSGNRRPPWARGSPAPAPARSPAEPTGASKRTPRSFHNSTCWRRASFGNTCKGRRCSQPLDGPRVWSQALFVSELAVFRGVWLCAVQSASGQVCV